MEVIFDSGKSVIMSFKLKKKFSGKDFNFKEKLQLSVFQKTEFENLNFFAGSKIKNNRKIEN